MTSGVVKVSDSENVFTIHVAPAVNVNPQCNPHGPPPPRECNPHGQANDDNGEVESQPANHE